MALNQPALPPTGHAVGFLNSGQYFMTGFGGTTAARPGAAAPITRPTAAAPTARR